MAYHKAWIGTDLHIRNLSFSAQIEGKKDAPQGETFVVVKFMAIKL